MTRLRLSARWIALIAAYAIALQVLLPAAFAAAAPLPFQICSGSTAARGDLPGDSRGDAGRSDCCLALCCAPLLAVPPSAPAVGTRDRAGVAASNVEPDALALMPLRGPQAARAPPRV